ncbi:MAG: MBL fold metallo-hydrolase [Nitrospirota bacterium]
MKLIILGSGTCVPSLKRNAPGYYLEAEGCRILVDCGSGTLLQLERAGGSYRDVDAVFITHKHPDHFADLMPLVHALLATPDLNRQKDLYIFSPKGFSDYYQSSVSSVLGQPDGFKIRVTEIQDRFDFGPFNVITAKTIHSSDSISYRFECWGKSVVFTGDADYDQGIIELARGADLLIADCSFPDSMKAKGHLSAKECGMVAARAGVGRLVLSHLYPADTPDADRIRESGGAFDGEIVLAEDLMIININQERTIP